MIVLYSGTPGSGKSLDCARTIYNWCRLRKPVLCNFPVNTAKIQVFGPKDVRFIPNSELNPDYLVEIAKEHFQNRKVKENSILLIVDEAQLLFNSRDWTTKDRSRWTWFFSMHRHFGYFIILCAQFDRMLDRQVRGLIEYEYIHRKVSNIGWRGWLLSFLMLSPGNLFAKICIWYPMKERISGEMFKAEKRFYDIYDTFALLDTSDKVEWQGSTQEVIKKPIVKRGFLQIFSRVKRKDKEEVEQLSIEEVEVISESEVCTDG